ncbi:hypothetical protein [Nostoc sp.]|uniref:hypothetical protein n=1 Tax=Nostoc sp. TaxID=1180 RepID=UPI002FF860A5
MAQVYADSVSELSSLGGTTISPVVARYERHPSLARRPQEKRLKAITKSLFWKLHQDNSGDFHQ